MLFDIFTKDCSEVMTLYYSVKTLFAYVTAQYINVRTYDFNVKLLSNTLDILFINVRYDFNTHNILKQEKPEDLSRLF